MKIMYPKFFTRTAGRTLAVLFALVLSLNTCSNDEDDDRNSLLLLLLLNNNSSSATSCGGSNTNWDGTAEALSVTTKNHGFKKFTPAASGTYTVTLTWTGTGDVDSLRLYVGADNTLMSTDPFNLNDFVLSDQTETSPATVTASVSAGAFRCIGVYARQCDSSATQGSGTCAYTIKVN